MDIRYIALYNKDNRLRPPNWRWELVLHLNDSYDSNTVNDQLVNDAISFCKKINLATSVNEIVSIQRYYPDIYNSWTIFTHEEYERLKSELEAMLLTELSFEEVGKKLNLESSVVEKYHDLFFDVKDRLDNKAFILNSIFSMTSSLDVLPIDKYWKLIAYFYGFEKLEKVIYNGPGVPDNLGDDAEESKFISRNIRNRILELLNRVIVNNSDQMENLVEITNSVGRVKLMNQPSERNNTSQGDLLDSVYLALKDISWGSTKANVTQNISDISFPAISDIVKENEKLE